MKQPRTRSDNKQTYCVSPTGIPVAEAVEDVNARYSKSDLAEMTTPAALFIKDSIAEVDNITLYDRDWFLFGCWFGGAGG